MKRGIIIGLIFVLIACVNCWSQDEKKSITVLNGSSDAGVSIVTVKLSPKTFTPIWRFGEERNMFFIDAIPCFLQGQKPDFITSEPVYQGAKQYYGSLKFGNSKNNVFGFALDVISEAKPEFVLYVDTNKDHNLNDEKPLRRGDGSDCPVSLKKWGYSAMVDIPWESLIVNSPYAGNFKAWFFISKGLWEKKMYDFYSRTQLIGDVLIDGKQYKIKLMDNEANDGDLTNDGFFIATAKDQWLDASKQKGEQDKILAIDGKKYLLRFTY